ncbi:hypothetical protein KF728_14785 [Candidatus Obscuribacterales bacterium]|nr:hypothetical protein [Candidatus Obscuribacterales bacterium]MBX3151416.1 hypothetical protein [Candidatus Obscuribacterales bacterium]
MDLQVNQIITDMHSLDFIPIWLVFTIFLVSAFLCVELGFRFGKYRRDVHAQEPEAAISAMIASTLALLAFILGFTFNMAANRYEERRAAVLTEANAIGTTYLRADFLEPPSRDHVKKLLRQYVAMRINIEPHQVEEFLPKAAQLQNDLWAEAAAAAAKHPTPITATFVNTLNDLIDSHETRVTALYSRVPPVVWICLLLITALSMAGIGFQCGLSGHRTFFGTGILVVAFGLVMLLVADLDRPLEGIIKTPQRPMLDLAKSIGPP